MGTRDFHNYIQNNDDVVDGRTLQQVIVPYFLRIWLRNQNDWMVLLTFANAIRTLYGLGAQVK